MVLTRPAGEGLVVLHRSPRQTPRSRPACPSETRRRHRSNHSRHSISKGTLRRDGCASKEDEPVNSRLLLHRLVDNGGSTAAARPTSPLTVSTPSRPSVFLC